MKQPTNSGKRIFAYDFVRVFACAGVFLFHLDRGAAEYFPYAAVPHMPEWTGFLFVTAFFMLSGCMMQLHYGSSCNVWDIREYYKKRIAGIYPAFYTVFFPLWILSAIRHGSLFYQGTKWTIVLSFLGVDGYFSSAFNTYYIIGEWFLGALIMLYLIYPLLRILMEKAWVALLAGSLVLFLLTADMTLMAVSPLANFPACLISFVTGMAFERFVRQSGTGSVGPGSVVRATGTGSVAQDSVPVSDPLRNTKVLILLTAGLMFLGIALRRSIGSVISLSIVFHLAGALVFLLLYRAGTRIDNHVRSAEADHSHDQFHAAEADHSHGQFHTAGQNLSHNLARIAACTYEFYLVHHWLIHKILKTSAGWSGSSAMLAAACAASLVLALLSAFLLKMIVRKENTLFRYDKAQQQ